MDSYLDSAEESFSVEIFVFSFDVAQIDFATADDDSNQGRVVGAPSLHGGFQSLGEVLRSIIQRFDCERNAGNVGQLPLTKLLQTLPTMQQPFATAGGHQDRMKGIIRRLTLLQKFQYVD